MYRTKSRGIRYLLDGGETRTNIDCATNHWPGATWSGSATVEEINDSWIRYEVSKMARPGVYTKMNNCRHESTKIHHVPCKVEASVNPGDGQYHRDIATTPGIYSISEASLSSVTEPDAGTLRNLNAMAWDAMYPSLEGDMSITNFVLELGDFSRLLDLVTTWSGLVKKGAEGHLGWSFGIRPMISDIKELYDSLMNYRQRIDDFIERAGQPQKRHFRYKFDEDDSETLIYESLYSKGYRNDESASVFHATLVYQYEIPTELYTIRGKLNAIRDMVGLRFRLAEVWEAIPFSFVIDWFFPIQRFLEGFSDPLIKPKLTVIDYCFSYKSYVKSSTWFAQHTKCGASRDYAVKHKYGSAIKKVYVRRKAIPETGTYFVPDSNRFGAAQLALSASLLILSKR